MIDIFTPTPLLENGEWDNTPREVLNMAIKDYLVRKLHMTPYLDGGREYPTEGEPARYILKKLKRKGVTYPEWEEG